MITPKKRIIFAVERIVFPSNDTVTGRFFFLACFSCSFSSSAMSSGQSDATNFIMQQFSESGFINAKSSGSRP